MSALTVAHDEPLLAVGSWDRVGLCRIVGTPNLEHLRVIHDQQMALVDRSDGRIAWMTVVEPRSMLSFDDKARKVAAQYQALISDHMIVGVQIVRTPGFLSAMLRSVMLGVRMMSRPRYPTTVAASLRDGAVFVAQHCTEAGFPLEAAALEAALASFLDRVGRDDALAQV